MALDYRKIIADESELLLTALRTGPLDAAVPGCPDWSLGDLAVHITGVQRWATLIVQTGVLGEPDAAPPTHAEATDAFAAATPKLLDALGASDPDTPCWNFTSGPQTTAFWFRRQALEVAMHRWDAESAISAAPTPVAPDLAVDVVDEFLHLMLQRVVDREQHDLTPVTNALRFQCADAPADSWTIETSGDRVIVHRGDGPSADATISAPAPNLALFIYGRIGIDDVEVSGSAAVFESWRSIFTF